jgi:hypothetical protein
MGLFGRKKQERLRGTARVISRSDAPYNASHSSLTMDLVVEVPGVPAYAHNYRKMVVAVSKWPLPGAVLPVTVDPDDHDDVDVPWDDMPRNSQVGKLQAEQVAALLRGENVPNIDPTDAALASSTINVVASQSNADPVERLEKLAKLRAAGIIDDHQFAQLRAQILEQAGLD